MADTAFNVAALSADWLSRIAVLDARTCIMMVSFTFDSNSSAFEISDAGHFSEFSTFREGGTDLAISPYLGYQPCAASPDLAISMLALRSNHAQCF